MENTSIIALSRESAIKREMSVIANNIANMNTTAFKGDKMMFAQYLVRSRGGYRIGGERQAYVRDVATVRDNSDGPMERTGNPLDLAIDGKGYFTVSTAAGDRYTRNGGFQLDQQGQLVNRNGEPLLSDQGDPFFFSSEDKSITIDKSGIISTENGTIGKIGVVTFKNPQELKVVAGGLYSSEQVPVPAETPKVIQGMLEKSNVQPIIEMTKMIEASRSYEGIKGFIEKEDARIKKMIAAYGQGA